MGAVSEQRKRVVIVGASDTGQALALSLSTTWEVVLFEVNPERLAPLQMTARPAEAQLRLVAKDGTSLLNLREAGLDGAEWLIAVTERDDVNVEICRLVLTSERPPAAVAVVGSAEAQEKLKAMGAEAIWRPSAMAGLIGNVINRGLRVAVNVGLGRGEVVEIPVLASSPTVNVRVADLRARRWLIAAIYRENQIIVPHGDAIIRAGDRLLLSGEPDILPDIAEYLRAGVARFPLQYGRRFVTVPGPSPSAGFWKELQYLTVQTRIAGVSLLRHESEKEAPPPSLEWGGPLAARTHLGDLPTFLQRERQSLDCGCLILPKRQSGILTRIGMTRPSYWPLLEALPCPILMAAGYAPYKRIVLAVTGSMDVTVAAELAVDLSRRFSLPLIAVTVSQPDFVSGSEHVAAQSQVLKEVNEVAAQYRVSVQPSHLNGNPVRELARFLKTDDLLVLSSKARRRASVLSPDAGMLLIEHSPCSVMVLSQRRGGRQETRS